MWEALSSDVSGWAVAGVLIIIIALVAASGRFVPMSLVNRLIAPYKKSAEEADKRAATWESAWYKLYAAQQIEQASEKTAVSEVALTLASTINGLRTATGTGGDEHVVPPQPPHTD